MYSVSCAAGSLAWKKRSGRQVAVVGESLPEVEARRDVHVVGESDRVVAAARQDLRERVDAIRQDVGLVHRAVRRRIEAGQDRRHRRAGPRCLRERVRAAHAVGRQAVDAGRLGRRVPVGAEMIRAQRVHHDEDHVRCARGRRRRTCRHGTLRRPRHQTAAACPEQRQDRHQRRGHTGTRERAPPGVRAAQHPPHHDGQRDGEQQSRQLHDGRERPGRKLLEEDVTDDAEAGHDEAERRPDARERQREAVGTDDRSDDSGAEPARRPDEPVDHQGPGDRRQIARAVRSEPGSQRLDGAHGRTGEQPAGDSRSHGPCLHPADFPLRSIPS